MGKVKNEGTKLKSWQTPKLNCFARGFFILDFDFFDHPAVRVLTPSTLKVLMLLQAHACGNETFNYPYAAAELAGVSNSTYTTALNNLQEAGFIRVASGKPMMTSNQITFISRWKTTEPTKPPRKSRGKSFKPKGADHGLEDGLSPTGDEEKKP